jgi:DNA-directed RNA polymerase subunit H (RpoH/RPB5)
MLSMEHLSAVKKQNMDNLLTVKKQSIIMMKLSGYKTEDDDPVLNYEVEDLPEYFDYARDDIKNNAIRKLLSESGFLKVERCCFSTAYESRARPGYFAVVYFAPPPQAPSSSIGKSLIAGPFSLCGTYPFAKQVHCTSCVRSLKDIKKCPRCPAQQYCPDCIEDLKCPNCVTEKWCPGCTTRIKRWTNYKLSLQQCKNCPQKDENKSYCETCTHSREQHSCKQCYRNPEGNLDKETCESCMSSLKCENCPSESFCEQCDKIREKIMEDRTCSNCPETQLCKKCVQKNKFEPCKRCPPPPQIIERFIVIAEASLSPEAKVAISGGIPRIKPSTGEWVETGQLVQIFLDEELFYNPLINSLKSSYKVLSPEEGAKLFDDEGNNITEHQIHLIDFSDVVCKYLGLFPGNVLRVERKQVVPGSIPMFEIIYRLVRLIPSVRKSRKRGTKKKPVVISGAVDEDF